MSEQVLPHDEIWGFLPAIEGWNPWFAWKPVKACERWRWLTTVQRRQQPPKKPPYGTHFTDDLPWEYRAGKAHDYPDSVFPEIKHFYTHTCRHCGAKYII